MFIEIFKDNMKHTFRRIQTNKELIKKSRRIIKIHKNIYFINSFEKISGNKYFLKFLRI